MVLRGVKRKSRQSSDAIMSTGTYRLDTAYAAAGKFLADMSLVVRRAGIAGSVRRRLLAGEPPETEVGDVEIVVIPTMRGVQNLLWLRMEALHYELAPVLSADGKIGYRAGEKYRKVRLPLPGYVTGTMQSIPSVTADIFCATVVNWGYILTLRTGPAAWNRLLVTHVSQSGLLPEHLVLTEGRVLWNGTEIAVPEEHDFFDLLEIPYVPPHERTAERARALILERAA